jgi:hypothetical protein
MSFLKFLLLLEKGNERNVTDLRDWVWSRTELVRWHAVGPGDDWTHAANDQTVKLLVVDVESMGTSVAWDVVAQTKQPVIAIHPDRTLMKPLVDKFPGMVLLSGGWQDSSESQERLETFLRKLGIPKSPPIDPQFDKNDLGLRRTLNNLAGVLHEPRHGQPLIEPWLRLTLAKYFGVHKRSIRLNAVRGGWSGTPVLEATVDGNIYYLKFFDKFEEFSAVCEGHQRAREAWLGDCAAEVQFIEGLPHTTEGLHEAFPAVGGKFPLCVRSASDTSTKRVTFHELYQSENFDVLQEALGAILQALDQPEAQLVPIPPSAQTLFLMDGEKEIVVLDTLHDLRRTLRQLCPLWDTQEKTIRDIIIDERPQWLNGDTPARTGHIHGDLNTRNSLCALTDPSSIRFIDLGDYRPDGILVHDLSMLEASIKWGAMGSEREPRYRFGDIDTQLLRDARKAEDFAIDKGLAFSRDDVFGILQPERRNLDNALTRAYALVGMVRAKAKKLCGSDDPYGKHYFAALLCWNLRWLKAPHVRRVKKVLALYSSALILEKFKILETTSDQQQARSRTPLPPQGASQNRQEGVS